MKLLAFATAAIIGLVSGEHHSVEKFKDRNCNRHLGSNMCTFDECFNWAQSHNAKYFSFQKSHNPGKCFLCSSRLKGDHTDSKQTTSYNIYSVVSGPVHIKCNDSSIDPKIASEVDFVDYLIAVGKFSFSSSGNARNSIDITFNADSTLTSSTWSKHKGTWEIKSMNEVTANWGHNQTPHTFKFNPCFTEATMSNGSSKLRKSKNSEHEEPEEPECDCDEDDYHCVCPTTPVTVSTKTLKIDTEVDLVDYVVKVGNFSYSHTGNTGHRGHAYNITFHYDGTMTFSRWPEHKGNWRALNNTAIDASWGDPMKDHIFKFNKNYTVATMSNGWSRLNVIQNKSDKKNGAKKNGDKTKGDKTKDDKKKEGNLPCENCADADDDENENDDEKKDEPKTKIVSEADLVDYMMNVSQFDYYKAGHSQISDKFTFNMDETVTITRNKKEVERGTWQAKGTKEIHVIITHHGIQHKHTFKFNKDFTEAITSQGAKLRKSKKEDEKDDDDDLMELTDFLMI